MSHELNFLKGVYNHRFNDDRYIMVHIDYDKEKWDLLVALFDVAKNEGKELLSPSVDTLKTRKVPLWFCLGSDAPRNWSNCRDESDLVKWEGKYLELSFECFYYMLFNFLKDYQG